MPVNSTGLNEIFTMPELSVHTAIRPGNPASVPDFLKIMAMKTAKSATPAAMPTGIDADAVPVGTPSAGDGNPTAAMLAAAGSEFAEDLAEDLRATENLQIAEDDTDMPLDLQIPAMLTPQEKPVAAAKLPGARFAAIAQQQEAQAPVETGMLPVAGTDENAANTDDGKPGRDDEDEMPALPVAVAMPAPSPAAAPVVVVAAAAAMPAAAVPAEAGDAAPAIDADAPRSANLTVPTAPARAPADAAEADAADTVSAEPALPLSASAPANAAQVRPEQSTVEKATAEKAAAEQPTRDQVARIAEDAAPVLRALGAAGRDSETPDAPSSLREAPAALSAPNASSVLTAPQEAARPVPAAAPAPAVLNSAQLDDLLIGNAVEDQWVDRLAADVEALVSNDRREAHMVLRPRELGEMSIRLETNAGQAKVHFTVETAAAQGFITDAAPRLQAMLEDRGVRLEGASVDVGGRQDRGERGEPPREAAPSARPRAAAAQPEIIRQLVRQTAIERYA